MTMRFAPQQYSSYAGLTRVSINLRNKLFFEMDGWPSPGYAKASPGFPVLVRRSFSEGGQARPYPLTQTAGYSPAASEK
jgi:hypothetical protein